MSAPRPAGKSILLVDDYADTRDLYTESLVASGYAVLTAASGREAIQVAQACVPDVILMDIRMPDISGVEVMQTLREDQRFGKVPILAFTANAQESARVAYVAAGFDAVIVKPCLPDELLAHINALCSRPRAAAAPAAARPA